MSGQGFLEYCSSAQITGLGQIAVGGNRLCRCFLVECMNILRAEVKASCA